MWLAVDKDGDEYIYSVKPSRAIHSFRSGDEYVEVPRGTIQRLLNYPLTWDDEAEEIVEYKDKDLKEDKMIKQNIKMRVTPEQSKKVQEICFVNGIYWRGYSEVIHTESIFLYYIDSALLHDSSNNEQYFKKNNFQEIDADLFIRTNGTCEEESTLNDDDITRISKASEDQPREYLKQKIVNLHDQLNKNRKTVQNQKEELTRLLNQKEELQSQLNMANKAVGMSIDTDIKLIRLLEEKDEIIKYLENKLAKKTNEAYEKKVMSFEELYIKQADEYYKKVEDKVMGFVKRNLKRELNN